jgi:hypothetical protein
MTHLSTIQDLRASLEAARLAAIEELAARGGVLTPDALEKIAHLQMALAAVREEIEDHAVKIGGGEEAPYK